MRVCVIDLCYNMNMRKTAEQEIKEILEAKEEFRQGKVYTGELREIAKLFK
jgi:hypothetical protein